MNCATRQQVGIKEVNAVELKSLIGQNITLIDVRTPGEYQKGRIEGATLINYQNAAFAEEISKLSKNDPVIVYCAMGGRSTKSAELMQGLGFTTIYNYTGGFSDWSSRGEPIEKD